MVRPAASRRSAKPRTSAPGWPRPHACARAPHSTRFGVHLMGLNAWIRGQPLLIGLVGLIIAAVGVVRGSPVPIVVGVLVVLAAIARAVLAR
jgi:hypothetical protein